MIKQHRITGFHLLQVISRLKISYTGPLGTAVPHQIVPGIGIRFLFYQPASFFQIDHLNL
jgi:hypothetical protein